MSMSNGLIYIWSLLSSAGHRFSFGRNRNLLCAVCEVERPDMHPDPSVGPVKRARQSLEFICFCEP